MLKIRRPLGRLIFNMGIAIPGKTVFLIETAPRIILWFYIFDPCQTFSDPFYRTSFKVWILHCDKQYHFACSIEAVGVIIPIWLFFCFCLSSERLIQFLHQSISMYILPFFASKNTISDTPNSCRFRTRYDTLWYGAKHLCSITNRHNNSRKNCSARKNIWHYLDAAIYASNMC